MAYRSPYRGVKKSSSGNFEHFDTDPDIIAQPQGHWFFELQYEKQAYEHGYSKPEDMIVAAQRHDDIPDVLIQWIPSHRETFKFARIATAEQHINNIASEQRILGIPESMVGGVPIYPLDLEGKLLVHRGQLYDTQPAVKEPKTPRCNRCKQLKKECSKERPSCERCVRTFYLCEYPADEPHAALPVPLQVQAILPMPTTLPDPRCKRCKHLRQGCDRQRPSCGRCVKTSHSCEYPNNEPEAVPSSDPALLHQTVSEGRNTSTQKRPKQFEVPSEFLKVFDLNDSRSASQASKSQQTGFISAPSPGSFTLGDRPKIPYSSPYAAPNPNHHPTSDRSAVPPLQVSSPEKSALPVEFGYPFNKDIEGTSVASSYTGGLSTSQGTTPHTMQDSYGATSGSVSPVTVDSWLQEPGYQPSAQELIPDALNHGSCGKQTEQVHNSEVTIVNPSAVSSSGNADLADLFEEDTLGLPDAEEEVVDPYDALLTMPWTCMECGVEDGHNAMCLTGCKFSSTDRYILTDEKTAYIPRANEELTQAERIEIANAVERRDPELWREHRYPPPSPPLEDHETKVKGMAEIIRNEPDFSKRPEFQGLSDTELILCWGLTSMKSIKAEVIWL
jgi:hypothetical protein